MTQPKSSFPSATFQRTGIISTLTYQPRALTRPPVLHPVPANQSASRSGAALPMALIMREVSTGATSKPPGQVRDIYTLWRRPALPRPSLGTGAGQRRQDLLQPRRRQSAGRQAQHRRAASLLQQTIGRDLHHHGRRMLVSGQRQLCQMFESNARSMVRISH